ncbi:MAG: prepilin-type N-terminal cleavage/methylation domain-containing protein [bacterium]
MLKSFDRNLVRRPKTAKEMKTFFRCGKGKAFTLIELLIVVAIIGILAAIAVPNFQRARLRSMVTRVRADLRNTAEAMEMYFLDNGKYIPSLGGASELQFLTTPVAYLPSVPIDVFLPNVKAPFMGIYSRNPDDLFATFDFWSLNGNRSHPQPPFGFVLSCIGPDRVHQHELFLAWEAAKGNPPPEKFNQFLYDMSNGLYSFGSIIRAGGEVRHVYN